MAKRRSRGEGSIYYLKSKKLWVSKITLPDGSRKVKYGKTQKEVREYHQKALNQIREGVFVKDEVTISEFLNRYLDTEKHSLRPKTIEIYSYLLRIHISPTIGHIKLTKLRPDHLQTLYSEKIDSGLSNSTVRLIHAFLRKSFNQALKWGLVNKNVVTLSTPPKKKNAPPAVLTSDQVNKFLNAVKDHPFYLIYLLAISCSFRIGEATGIHIEDCDLENGTIQVIHTIQDRKGGLVISEPKTESSRRLVTVPETTLIALKKHIEDLDRDSGLIFTTRTGKPIAPYRLTLHLRKTMDNLGLQHIRFHDLRHISATLLLTAGVHPKVVQERLGHSTISQTLDTYSHVMPTLQEDAARKMDGILSHP